MKLLNGLNFDEGMGPRRLIAREGGIERGCVYLCTGESNSGKSTVLQLFARCLAHGTNFGPWRTVGPMPVGWVAGEDSFNARLRIGGMIQHLGGARTDKAALLAARFSLSDPASMWAFRARLEQALGTDIAAIFLDSKAVLWGGDNENSNSEASAFMRALRSELAEPYDAAIFLLHHVTKRRNAPGSPDQSARGASALINDADAEIRFTRSKAGRMTMEPGMKLRGKRWAPLHFENQHVVLDRDLFPTLVDEQGYMPEINIAVPAGTATKVIDQVSQSDIAERVDEDDRRVFRLALEEYGRRNIRVPAARRGSTAYHVLKAMPEVGMYLPDHAWELLEQLVSRGDAQVVEHTDGSRHKRKYFELTEAGQRACNAHREDECAT